jgi:hypothetical protein
LEQNVRIANNILARRAEVQDAPCRWGDIAKGVNVRHDVVSHALLVFCGGIEINVVDRFA